MLRSRTVHEIFKELLGANISNNPLLRHREEAMPSAYSLFYGPAHIAKAVLLVALIAVTGTHVTSCSGKLMSAGRNKSGVDAEAQQEAEKYWGSLLTKCGGTIYGKDNREAVDQIYEFRDVSIRIKSRALSDADRMNGIEWSGDAYFDSKTSRVLTGAKWGPWRNGSIWLNSQKMEKVNGQWKFGVTTDARPPLRTLDCSQLP